MFSDSMHRRLLGKAPWSMLLLLLGPVDCCLILAYLPSLADCLESWVIVDCIHPPEPRSGRPGNLDVEAPGIDQPVTYSADKAALEDDTLVVGVYVSGQARAYLLESLRHGPEFHIVNDLLGDVPISVTHCDISGCTRVFTGATPGQTLTLSVGGRKDGRLLLKYDGHLFRQETGESVEGKSVFPYREYPAVVTEWGAWRKAHPQTDVYLGAMEEAMPPAAEPASAF